jgi:putative molybdopterin biosynthesis protein
MDGFAVQARDTFDASEDRPRELQLNGEVLIPGIEPRQPIQAGTAASIATGAVIPRGADAVVMVEYTDVIDGRLVVRRPVAPGANITFAGTDIGRGELVLRKDEVLTSRETGVLAALGLASVAVIRRPRIAIISTGKELISPGRPMLPGRIFDSNGTVLADAVRELGGEPIPFGIVDDDQALLEPILRRALECDIVLLSGGTSKGAGDLSYRVVANLGPPGIIAHGVALKPGKPLCLAAVKKESDGKMVPVVILPGFPTSAIFTFHEFVAPLIRRLGGRLEDPTAVVQARLPQRVNSERGRTEYLLVGLVSNDENREPPWIAYPMGKGSGSVTAFSRADGFITIPRQREFLEAGDTIDVNLLSQGLKPVDLVVIGSHCVGLDWLLGRLHDKGLRSKFLAVGSTGGLAAARRGECDLAGIHLLDPKTNIYNRPFLGKDLVLLRGYGRLQGIVFRPGDNRFEGHSVTQAIAIALGDSDCMMVNRNRGSGTRVLIDQLLGNSEPPGYWTEARSHNAVVAAVSQGRADWGVAIEPVAKDLGLGFLPLLEERYDFVVPQSRLARPAVQSFREILTLPETLRGLKDLGFSVPSFPGW